MSISSHSLYCDQIGSSPDYFHNRFPALEPRSRDGASKCTTDKPRLRATCLFSLAICSSQSFKFISVTLVYSQHPGCFGAGHVICQWFVNLDKIANQLVHTVLCKPASHQDFICFGSSFGTPLIVCFICWCGFESRCVLQIMIGYYTWIVNWLLLQLACNFLGLNAIILTLP